VHVLLPALAAGSTLLAGILWAMSRARRGRPRSGTALRMLALGVAAALLIGAPTVLSRAAPIARPRSGTSTPTASFPAATWSARTVTSGPGYARIPRLRIPVFPAALRRTTLRRPVALPRHGLVGSVVIPAVRSHFVARPAIVYLPPAARVAQPELLPVVVAFSGQSTGAGPRDLVWSGHLQRLMDGIAARHHGVAPIVVVPDQLGPASANPMCVDSKRLGHVATWVLDDVRRWILDRLPVETGRRRWTVAGFSEGGTCAVQFALTRPDVFGSFVDVSGESAPTNGSRSHTIAVGFGGSERAYLRATPAWLLSHHRYPDEDGLFAVGALDRTYGLVQPVMVRRARAAGLTTGELTIRGMAHSWLTADAGLRWGFDHLVGRWGIRS
jgi:S-formylglutathione hydrolase FrmB